jgi:WD40 repeat protein
MDGVLEAFGRHRLLTFDHDHATREPTVEIAHEALLGAWDRLRDWIDEARDDIRAERRLAVAAAEWDANERDPSFLLRGARLDQTKAWAETTTLAVSERDRTYLDECLAVQRAALEHERALERRSIRRLRSLVGLGLAAALVASTLTVVALDQRGRAEDEARISHAQELAAASVANLEVDPELSILLAVEAVRKTRSANGSVLPEAEEALHRAISASRLELEVPGLGGLLAWSPREVFVTEGPEGSGLIDIRDSETGERVRSFQGHDGDVNDVAFSPEGSMFASTGEDGTLKVWDASTWRLISSFTGRGAAWGPSFSADGSLVAAAWDPGTGNGQVQVFDASGHRVASTVDVPPPIDTALSPDGERIAVASSEGSVNVFDVGTREKVFTLAGGNCCTSSPSRGVSWSPDGRLIAASSRDAARVWDAESGTLRHTLLGHSSLVSSVAWSPDSSRLVTGSLDGTAKVWEIRSGGEQWSLSAQETRSGVAGVAFSGDGTRVMAADADITAVKVWDLGPTGNSEWAHLPAKGIPPAEFMPDGRRVVTTSPGGDDSGRAVTIWDLRTGRDLRSIGPPTDFFRFDDFDVRPDGGSIALGGWSNPDGPGGASSARAWETSTGEELYSIGHALNVNEVAFSPDGEYLATASWDATVQIVDRGGRVVEVLGGSLPVSDVAFNFDGRLVAAAEFSLEGGQVRIWDWAGEERILTIDVGSSSWPRVDFDPTGPRVVLTGSDGLGEVWDVDTRERLAVLAGSPGAAKDLEFSPDGSRIAIASVDGRVRLFDADTGAPQLVLPGSGCAVEGVAFSPDGTKLASSSGCDGVRIWALDIDDLLGIARREAGRSLTDDECRRYLRADRCPSV